MNTPPTLTSTEVVDRLRSARAVEKAAALEQVELAVIWARLHPCAEGEQAAYWGDLDLHGETTVWLTGEGSPSVGEFAPIELAAALGITAEAGHRLLADAVELHRRLPRLMEHVRSGLVPVWLARKIAALTTDLCWDAVVRADRLLSATPERMNEVHAEKLVHEVRLYFDPDRAAADEAGALEKRGVWLRRGADLKDLGDTDSLDVRRAKAPGIMADPQHALDLMSGREGAAPTKGASGVMVGDWVVHFRPEDFADGTGDADLERLGAITTDLLATWLARHAMDASILRVRPVLDLGEDWAVDQHDPPERMREQVVLLHSTCVFPGCRRDSRAPARRPEEVAQRPSRRDLDHIEPYVPPDDGGPPGQTRPENLAPLCRRHHRVKTHTAWVYKQIVTGHFTWTSPTGHQYDVRSTPRHPRRTS